VLRAEVGDQVGATGSTNHPPILADLIGLSPNGRVAQGKRQKEKV